LTTRMEYTMVVTKIVSHGIVYKKMFAVS
jgi:hypothetical protein